MLIAILLWLLALAMALGASELLVHELSLLGSRLGLTATLLGLLVAAGADAPEVTSALAATVQGSNDVGVGVVLGSNIYNLAGILGLAATLGGPILAPGGRVPLDLVTNLLLTALLMLLIAAPGLRTAWALALLLAFAGYAIVEARGTSRIPVLSTLFPSNGPTEEMVQPADATSGDTASGSWLLLGVAVVVIVAASDLLVTESIRLGHELHVPNFVVGTVVLAIATSLPNTWAVLSLVRHRMPESTISATCNSNSINAAFGAAVPALIVIFQGTGSSHALDAGWLALMTVIAAVMVLVRRSVGRVGGLLLIGLYAGFLALRLVVVR